MKVFIDNATHSKLVSKICNAGKNMRKKEKERSGLNSLLIKHGVEIQS